jgi:pseudaminic acid synthase
MASKQKPMIISTGVALKEEIYDVINICKEVGNENIILLQCTSSYPAPLEDANLLTIPDLAKTFGVIVGLSDHTMGATAPIVAVTLGAKVIEKHFIIDKSIGGADCEFSMEAQDFKKMVEAIRDSEKLLGKVEYSMTEKKQKSRNYARSLYVAKDIKKGEVFTNENVKSVRPGYGLHPKYLPNILGTTALKDFSFGDRLEL